MTASDVIVIGGGVIGCSVAFHLARSGVSVCVLEGESSAAQASSAAAAMLAPRAVALGEAPLAELGARAFAQLRECLPELRDSSGIDPKWRATGVLRALDAPCAPEHRKRVDALRERGAEWLDRDALRKLEPRVGPGVEGALYFPDEGVIDPRALTLAYARAATASGARFEPGAAALGVRVESGRACGVETRGGLRPARAVALCAGAWSGALAGVAPVPVRPVRGQMLELEAPQPPLPALLWGETIYCLPWGDGMRVGATEESVGFDARVTAAGLVEVIEGAARLLPALAGCGFRRAWAGLRPGTPDGLPLLGWAEGCEGLVLATGHGRHGILLSEWTGACAARMLLGEPPPAEAALCAPRRFARTAAS